MNANSRLNQLPPALESVDERAASTYTPPDGTVTTVQEQLRNAQYIADACNAVLTRTKPPTQAVMERYDDLAPQPWMGDITRSLISNDVLTVEPAGIRLPEEKSGERDEYAMAVAGLLRAIAPPNNRMSVISVHHELSARTRPDSFGQNLRRDVARLATRGALLGSDVPGRQFTIVPSQMFRNAVNAPGDILDQLRSSKWGEMGSDPESNLCFRGTPELAAVVKTQSHVPQYGSKVTLKTLADEESLPLLHTRALQEVITGPRHNHLVLTDSHSTYFFNNVSSLLRATNTIKHHQFHSVVSSLYDRMSHEQFSHLIGLKFLENAERFITATTEFAQFDVFDPNEYADRNYGGIEALLEDQNICKIVSFALSWLGIKNARAADIGCGPNPYPAMLFAPYASSIDLPEYAQPNRDYMDDFLAGRLPQSQMQIWPKFGRYMVEGGGDPYIDVLPRLQQMAAEGRVRVQFGDARNLPKNRWNLASMYFVDDSISLYRSDQREVVASVCEAVEFEGLVIAGNMLNDKDHFGYKAGNGKVYPNVSQNAAEVKQGYTDNEMYSLVIETSGTKKARIGYSGMAVVLAAHRGSEMHKKLEALKPQLESMGFKVI